jgi:hypothetical protein
MATGICTLCQRKFCFDMERVPSIQGLPICAQCITAINDQRRQRGFQPIPVLPGAYPTDDAEPGQ